MVQRETYKEHHNKDSRYHARDCREERGLEDRERQHDERGAKQQQPCEAEDTVGQQQGLVAEHGADRSGEHQENEEN